MQNASFGYADVPITANIANRQVGPNVIPDTGSTARSVEQPVKAISASGSGRVNFDYSPEASDQSSKIVFIQVMRESLDGVAVKPSVASPGFAYQDADTTSDMHHVDYVSGEKDPYYNGDDSPDKGKQGNATSKPPVEASMDDEPEYHDPSFPAGKSQLLWEFRTAAFSAEGGDLGTYYGFADWNYAKAKGTPGKVSVAGTTKGDPGGKFKDAVTLFNSNHGFVPGAGLGKVGSAVVGGLLGGGTGALIGGVFGGPLGAIVGAGIGALAGAITGAIAG
jgi:hypothetical protein